MSDEDWAARLASSGDDQEPDDPGLEEDLYSGVPDEYIDVPMPEIIAGAPEVSASEARAQALADAGLLDAISIERRGPGYSEPMSPGEYANPTAALAHGGVLDTAVPCGTLALFVEDAAGDDGAYRSASADEVMGAVCAWDRIEAYAAARKYQAVAAFIQHRPAPGFEAEVPGGMPQVWEEFTPNELAHSLADGLYGAEVALDTAYDLAVKLPGTMRALLAGDIRDGKARIIVRATANLNPDEARAAEEHVLDRAGRLTPGGLRAAIARAVMEIAPDKARRHREEAAKTRCVEVRAEESGNASVSARELSPELAAAIDTELTARARELKKLGIGEHSGDRRVLALLERFGLAGDLPGGPGGNFSGYGERGYGERGPAVPGKLNLTVPLRTVQGQADRPGELAGYGPIDPELARRLADTVLAHPQTKVCVTVTNERGETMAHGCARPPTRTERDQLRKPPQPHGRRPGSVRSGQPGCGRDPGPDPPGPGGPCAFAPMPGSERTWVLDPGGGTGELIVVIWPVSTDPCDHRLQTARHHPGAELRHVTELRYGTCTSPVCRRPAWQSDFEHNRPYEEGGLSCLCNGNPKCRRDHRLKQHRGWRVDQHADGRIVWTAPTGRTATTWPHQYPI
jgi:hypothetical protein